MAYTPRNAGSTGHAQGAHPGSLNAGVPNPSLDPHDQSVHNRVGDINIASVAPDAPNDRDYDNPYPGGATKTLGVPGDG